MSVNVRKYSLLGACSSRQTGPPCPPGGRPAPGLALLSPVPLYATRLGQPSPRVLGSSSSGEPLEGMGKSHFKNFLLLEDHRRCFLSCPFHGENLCLFVCLLSRGQNQKQYMDITRGRFLPHMRRDCLLVRHAYRLLLRVPGHRCSQCDRGCSLPRGRWPRSPCGCPSAGPPAPCSSDVSGWPVH